MRIPSGPNIVSIPNIFTEFLILFIHWRKHGNGNSKTINMAIKLYVCPWYCNLMLSGIIKHKED
jgi:hypothetical protein